MPATTFYLPTTATSSTSLVGDVNGTLSSNYISDLTITGKLLSGLSITPGTVTSSDSISSAIGKLTSGTINILANSIESLGTTLNIATANNTQTINLGSGTGVQTINLGNSGAGATTINLGGTTDSVNVAGPVTLSKNIYLNNQVQNKMLALYDGGTSTDSTMHNYIGLGNSTSTFRFQSIDTLTDFVFYAATSTTASNEVLRIKGTGNVGIGNGSSIGAGASGPTNTLDVFGNATFGPSTNRPGRITLSTAAITAFAPQAGSGNFLRLIREYVGKIDINFNNSSGKWVEFVDTDNGSVVPLSLAMDGSGNVKLGAITTPSLTLPGSTALAYYEEYTHNTTFSGPATVGSYALHIVQVGKKVTLYFSDGPRATTVTAGQSMWIMQTALPARFRPVSGINTVLMGVNNNLVTIMNAVATNLGDLIISMPSAPGVTYTGTIGWNAFSLSWTL